MFKKRFGDLSTLSLTGGEPTLNTDLFDILKEARSVFPKTEIAILTNGRMFFYKDYMTKFCSLDTDNIKAVIPLYGHTAALHDLATRVSGSFKQTIYGIRNLLDKNILVEIRVIINRVNYLHLDRIAALVFDELKGVIGLVFVAMELNKDTVDRRMAVRYSELAFHLNKAMEIPNAGGINTKLFHFPLCVTDQKYWGNIFKSIEDYKLTYIKKCAACARKKECMGILKTYLSYNGPDEFKPF